MDPILTLHRQETIQADPEAVLRHFPGAFVQYVDDSPRRDPRKARSTPYFLPSQAEAKQQEGCGVYFSPNAFLGARRLRCLQRIQAVFLDIDAGKEGDGQSVDALERKKADALLSLLGSPRPPHIVTETKHGLQPLWRIVPLDVPGGLALFRQAIDVLLRRFHADPAARDPVRPIRLPGFLHLKNPAGPFRCRLLWNDLDRDAVDLQSLIDDHYLPPADPPARQALFVSSPPTHHPVPDVAEVIRLAAREAGIEVTLRMNRDGSRQIIENGVVTSGFISSRGNFCYSASGKARKGGPVQLARFYLGLDAEGARRWLDARFGRTRSRQRPAPSGEAANPPDRLAQGPARAMDVPTVFPPSA